MYTLLINVINVYDIRYKLSRYRTNKMIIMFVYTVYTTHTYKNCV